MKNSNRVVRSASAAMLGLFAVAGCASNDGNKPDASAKANTAAVAPEAKPLRAAEAVLATVTAEVVAIDHTTREMTLKDAGGQETTLVVDKRVKRLNEVDVGDRVRADYYVSLAGELRPPTEEEKAHPVVIVEGAGRTPQGEQPAAGAARAIKVVTVVEAIDLPRQTVTLRGQGPLRQNAVVRAKSAENLKKIRVGDTIVVTYTEALAVSLEKMDTPSGSRRE